MRCERCGTILSDHSSFCKNCGMRQHDQTAPRRPAIASATGEYKHDRHSKRARREKRIRRALLIVCALLAVATFALGIISYIQEKTMRAVESADDLVTSALAGYIDSNGAVSPENGAAASLAVYQSALDAVSRGMFDFAEQGDDCVVIGLLGGGYYIYMPFDGETECGASAVCESASDNYMHCSEDTQVLKHPLVLSHWNGSTVSADAKRKIVTLQPYCTETKQTDPLIWNYPDLAAETITANFNTYSFSDKGTADDNNRDDAEVSLDFLKSLSNYSIVIWQGHGVYWKWFGSILGTTETFNMGYFFDFINARVFVTNGLKMAVTSKFFDKYLHKNTNEKTLIYLGNCESGKDPKCRLVDTFLKKGFDCVVANSDSISRPYNLDMMKEFFQGMSGGTGEFLSAQEALDSAKLIYGNYDPYPTGYQAVPVLYGDTTLRFAADNSQTFYVSNDNATSGNATSGNATAGNATTGNATAGNATAGSSAASDTSQGPSAVGTSESPENTIKNGTFIVSLNPNEAEIGDFYKISTESEPYQTTTVNGGFLLKCAVFEFVTISYDEYTRMTEGETIQTAAGEIGHAQDISEYEDIGFDVDAPVIFNEGRYFINKIPDANLPELLRDPYQEIWTNAGNEGYPIISGYQQCEYFISDETMVELFDYGNASVTTFGEYMVFGNSEMIRSYTFIATVQNNEIIRLQEIYAAIDE